MNWPEIAGHFGAFLSSITLMPQVWKAWKSKSVGDLSIYMILIILTSTVVWLYYGVSLGLLPVVLCNGIILLLSAVLLYLKLRYSS